MPAWKLAKSNPQVGSRGEAGGPHLVGPQAASGRGGGCSQQGPIQLLPGETHSSGRRVLTAPQRPPPPQTHPSSLSASVTGLRICPGWASAQRIRPRAGQSRARPGSSPQALRAGLDLGGVEGRTSEGAAGWSEAEPRCTRGPEKAEAGRRRERQPGGGWVPWAGLGLKKKRVCVQGAVQAAREAACPPPGSKAGRLLLARPAALQDHAWPRPQRSSHSPGDPGHRVHLPRAPGPFACALGWTVGAGCCLGRRVVSEAGHLEGRVTGPCAGALRLWILA